MRKMRAVSVAFLLLLVSLFVAASPQTAKGRGGAIAAAEETAARVGIEILKSGGNATDAAVAVAFALAVTWPEAGNIGGGGFWVSRDPRGRVTVLDFREVAPHAARRDLFTRRAPDGKPPSSTEGPLASGVPGSVAGLAAAHRRGGHLPWAAVVEPAVRLARDGFVVSETVARSIASEKERLARDPETAAVFLADGAPPAAGSRFRQPDLARTLEAIRDRGADGFYRGVVARRIEQGQQRQGGLISRGDLGRYEVKTRRALSFSFQDAQVVTTPAPSSGPVLAEMALLVQILGAERFRGSDAASAHLLSEIEKRAFRDRNVYLGDPSFPGVRQALLTDRLRLKKLAAGIDPNRATPSEALRIRDREKPTTTHFSVVDGEGGAVSVTTTLNDSFGNARIAPGLGFLWNNEMDDFTARPGQKNLYGLVQGEVNSVAPGKRMLSSMCPAIAVVDGRALLVWGSPGGSTIPTTNLQVMLGVLLRHEPLEGAVAAPRFHQQDHPDTIQMEPGRFDPPWVATLQRLGHVVVERTSDGKKETIGRVHAVARSADGRLTAVADPRSGGVGLVVHPEP